MNLNFKIGYSTSFGEEIVLNILPESDEKGEKPVAYRMHTYDGKTWETEIKTSKKADALDYFYSVCVGEREIKSEWRLQPHRLELNCANITTYHVEDRWIDIPEDSYLYSSAFTDCINRSNIDICPIDSSMRLMRVKVRAPQLRENESLYLVGDVDYLGAWDIAKALPMRQHNYNEWIIDLDVNQIHSMTIEYKFVVKGIEDMWETCPNRTLDVLDTKLSEIYVKEVDHAFFPIWNRNVAGTLMPVFSLRSERSFGVGDFGDLKKMIDWVSITGQRVLQLLPVNDTTTTHTWTDSYPYSCISIFALHPQYVNLNLLPQIADEKKCKEMEDLRKELNALPQIDYERVNDAKTEYLRIIFGQEGQKVLAGMGFKAFFDETKEWLVPYAQYCLLRDTYGTADFSQWPDHQTWNEADRKSLSSSRTKAFKEVSFYYYVQYLLNTQLESVHEYAKSRGVVLKGDIPIGVSRYGADIWQEPRYFNKNGQAGAPPDDFSENGQNWGFPTYNWDEMVKDGCHWWVRRFRNMSKFFDAYRIDHVLGFFRIWEIPIDAVHGLLGQFSPVLAMTRDEIEAYGLHFQETLFTRPFIRDWVVERIFGKYAKEVTDTYLEPLEEGFMAMKKGFETERLVEKAFKGKTSEKDILIRDGLYTLIENVLFLRDHKDKDKFHPRISAYNSLVYESLYDSDKNVFNRLYNDYYYRRNNQFWYREAMKKLPLLVQATRMLVCAEDLGMVPDCVPWVMGQLKILSLELQSMPKTPGLRFGYLSSNPYRSVCTISSHDMPTLRQWWDEDTERTQDYYNSMLYRGGDAPHPLPGWLARDIIMQHMQAPSMLTVISMQDWLAIDEDLRLPDQNAERINIPANPKHYWRYRMHINLETLLKSDDFNTNVRNIVSGR